MQPITLISIVASISALFGYIIKLSWPYFLRRLEEKDGVIEKRDEYIRTLTASFLEATNHKTTEFTKAIYELKESQERGNAALISQTEIFKQMVKDRNIK